VSSGCDNGPELACSAMAHWAVGQVELYFIPPGEPWRNGYGVTAMSNRSTPAFAMSA
jgi:hypothetical protein